jgi:hypothetical protein
MKDVWLEAMAEKASTTSEGYYGLPKNLLISLKDPCTAPVTPTEIKIKLMALLKLR